jgi:2-keto-4-pentenoate hydratase
MPDTERTDTPDTPDTRLDASTHRHEPGLDGYSAEECRALGARVAEHWMNRTTLPVIDPSITMAHATCARDEFLRRLQPLMGAPLGYKVSAITPPAQRDLGVREPLGGIYLAGMFRMLDTPQVTVPVSYGARPIVEAKLMVAVLDDAINEARTPKDVAPHLAYVIPSIELGDSLAAASQHLTGAVLTVYNVGARGMLNATPLAFDGSARAIETLRDMVVTTSDDAGNVLDVERGSSIMGDPLAAVLWIVRHCNARGVRLRAGDRLGLGALSRVRPTPGSAVHTVWEGLTASPVTITVRFQ